MRLYKKLEQLSQWFKYQATYYEMEYHLKQVLNNKDTIYTKFIYNYDRCIGKSVALARLSAKYDIPVLVPTHAWKREIEEHIPMKMPKYFKKRKPMALVENENMKGRRYKALLFEERLIYDYRTIALDIANGKAVGYYFSP